MPADPGPRRTIPIAAAEVPGDSDCGSSEPFALMVVGDSMAPEFADGEIIIVEPGGRAGDGSFVVARVAGDWTFRQLARCGEGWQLRALSPAYPAMPLDDLAAVRGVVIQKARPGRRRAGKRYVD